MDQRPEKQRHPKAYSFSTCGTGERPCELTACRKPSAKSKHVSILGLDCQPPELGRNKWALFKPPSLHFVMVDREDRQAPPVGISWVGPQYFTHGPSSSPTQGPVMRQKVSLTNPLPH